MLASTRVQACNYVQDAFLLCAPSRSKLKFPSFIHSCTLLDRAYRQASVLFFFLLLYSVFHSFFLCVCLKRCAGDSTGQEKMAEERFQVSTACAFCLFQHEQATREQSVHSVVF